MYHRGDVSTSVEAAHSMKDVATAHRRHILRILSTRPDGLIHTDFDAIMGWDRVTAARRCTELLQMGLITRTGEKRKTPSNRSACVYVITDAGRAVL
jgi:hypothetical protein